MTIDIKRGDKISFDMIMPGIFGTGYSNATVTSGEMDYNTARAIDPEIGVKHAAFFPHFKEKVNNIDNPSAYGYFSIQVGNSPTPIVIGMTWIDEVTFRHVSTNKATIVIANFEERHRAPINDFMSNLNVNFTLNVTES